MDSLSDALAWCQDQDPDDKSDFVVWMLSQNIVDAEMVNSLSDDELCAKLHEFIDKRKKRKEKRQRDLRQEFEQREFEKQQEKSRKLQRFEEKQKQDEAAQRAIRQLISDRQFQHLGLREAYFAGVTPRDALPQWIDIRQTTMNEMVETMNLLRDAKIPKDIAVYIVALAKFKEVCSGPFKYYPRSWEPGKALDYPISPKIQSLAELLDIRVDPGDNMLTLCGRIQERITLNR